MKQKFSLRWLCATILFLYATQTWAYSFETDGIYYNIVSSTDLTCEVTYRSGSYNTYSGSVAIPETVISGSTTYTVIGIGNSAFRNSSTGSANLTEVMIPTTVTYIGSYAFYDSAALTSITIPNSVTSIGDYAFYHCEALPSINIPNSVTSIGNYAFQGCTTLSEITIPSSVTSIGTAAFLNCTNLTKVTLEDGEETLTMSTSSSYTPFTSYSSSYKSCPIETLYLGRNISYTSPYAPFREQTTLKSLAIGEQVTSIDAYEFYGCTALEGVSIPSNVTSIETYAFYNCNSMSYANISEGVETIGTYAFSSCSSLTEFTIPNSVSTIGTYAFNGCSSLKEISVGSGVTSIGSYTFNGCNPDEMYFYGRLDSYYLVFTGLNCGTLYAHEDQVDAIKAEYSGIVVPLEDVYSLSAEGVYPRSIALKANVNEKLMVDGVSLKSVTVGRNELTESNGLYIAKNLIPNQTYTCTLTFLYDNQERTDQIEVTTEDFCKEATLQSSTPTSLTFAISLNEDAYSSLPDEYGLMYDGANYPADEDGQVAITGLKGSTEYTFELYAIYDGSTIKGESVTATTLSLTAPTVTTSSATDVTDTSATLNGSVTAGNEDILEKGFEYWTTQDDVTAVVATEDFSVTLTDLTPGTTYTYRAYVKTDSGTTYGEEMTFTTSIVAPTVQTVSATDITHNSATLTATITAGSEEIEEQGFEYRPSSASSSDVQTIIGDGEEMTVTLTGLFSNTTYLYCAYAKTASKTTYGEEKAFTTTVLVAPTVQTNAATNITATSATLNGSITAGSEEIEEKGFEYWATSGDDTDVHTTIADDNMSATVTGLTPSMMYLFRAYAKTESGTTYGSAMSFTTEAEVIVPPTVQTFEATQITTNSAQLIGFVTAGSEEIQELGFEYWLSSSDKQIVTASGEYISVVVEDLESSATYTYRAYAKTESTTTYGDSMTFTTLFDADSAEEDLSDDIEDAKKQLEDVWNDIEDNYQDIADEFKDEYDELMDELEDLLEQLEDAYNNGTLTEELAEEIRAKIEEIIQKIKDLLEAAKQAQANYELYTSLVGEINGVETTLDEAWDTITSDYSDVADEFKDEYESLLEELTSLLQELEDAYNNGTLDEKFAEEIRAKLAEIKEKIEQMLEDAKQRHEFPYDFLVDGIYYKITSSSSLTVEALYGLTSSPYSDIIIIPSTVTNENVTYTVTSVGGSPFPEGSITSITLPSSITSVGEGSFSNCSSLTTVVCEWEDPSKVSVSESSFEGIYHTATLYIPLGTVSVYQASAPWNLFDDIEEYDVLNGSLKYSVKNGGAELMTEQDTSLSGSVVVAENVVSNGVAYKVTSLAYQAFLSCDQITSITLPNTVTNISSYAFRYCKGLESVNIPDGVTIIDQGVFDQCESLLTIDFPDNVTSIGWGSLSGCSALAEVTLRTKVTYVYDYAFAHCYMLKSFTSLNPEPPVAEERVFYDTDQKSCTLYVPKGAKEAYSTADVWKDFYNIVELGSSDGIEGVATDGKEVEGVYNLSGVRVNTPVKDNVYIIRYSDGTTKKLYVK